MSYEFQFSILFYEHTVEKPVSSFWLVQRNKKIADTASGKATCMDSRGLDSPATDCSLNSIKSSSGREGPNHCCCVDLKIYVRAYCVDSFTRLISAVFCHFIIIF